MFKRQINDYASSTERSDMVTATFACYQCKCDLFWLRFAFHSIMLAQINFGIVFYFWQLPNGENCIDNNDSNTVIDFCHTLLVLLQ